MITVKKSELEFCWPINWLGLHRNYLNDGEMEIIAALLRDVEAQSMIEIGCRDGRTARVLLHNVTSLQRYIGVDVPMSYEPALAHQRAEMTPDPGALVIDDPRFELCLRERGSLDLSAGEFDRFFDACFIDGDHSEDAVYHDSELARVLVRPGGICIWHDYCNAAVDVQRALGRLQSGGWPIEHVEGTWLAFSRV